MNQTTAYSTESQFGPPSGLIDLTKFLQEARERISSGAPDSFDDWESWTGLASEQKGAVEAECSVDDLQSIIADTLRQPVLFAHLAKTHEENLNIIQATADPKGALARARKRKRSIHPEERGPVHAGVAQLRNVLDNLQLSSWPYTIDAAAFMRGPKNSDLNALEKVRTSSSSGPDAISSSPEVSTDAVVIVSVHSRLSWGNHLSRSSQHAVLASQTLGDLYEVIPCPSNEIPVEKQGVGEFRGYEEKPSEHRGGVICIEGVAYGDGQNEEDYADKLIRHIETLPEAKRPVITKGICMHDEAIATLSVRINQPYWLLHQGNCEHFLVIDQIRLQHPDDLRDGYPLTLQVTPPILDLCQACSKVPAVWSIVNDIRLGQSPCLLCAPCWRIMGDPQDDGVLAVPLPKHQLGW